MRARLFALAVIAACVGYLILSLDRVRQFLELGGVGVIFSVATIGVAGVSALLIAREIQFGRTMAKMAAALEAAGGLPVDDLPKTADGRVERSAADARFESYRKAVESDETSWENWYRLAIGYDDSRDRRRAREAMRTAAKLFQSR